MTAIDHVTTVYATAASLDGFLADEDDSLEWLFQFGDAGVDEAFAAFLDGVGALAMGSTTYEWLLEHERLLEAPGSWPHDVPAWVFSRRALPPVAGADLRFVRGDVAPVHAEMVREAAGADVWLVGGGDLVGQFHDAGLLDELVVTVAPVTLGSGAPLLPRRITDPPLRLVDVDRPGEAFAVLTYAVEGSGEDEGEREAERE